MDVREKLVAIVEKASERTLPKNTCHTNIVMLVNALIEEGVTVQERKPLEAFLRPIDAYKGLKAKYLVFKADTGEQVVNCFVLRPDKDTAAVEVLRAYARNTDNETLAEDIYNWIGKGEPVQEWISVKERKPDLELVEAKGDDFDLYACLATIKNDRARNGRYVGKVWYDGEQFMDSDCVDITYNVTHWTPLPQPPKGE